MDVNDVRILVTLTSLVLFLALVVHTWSRRRKADHEQAAMLPFLDDSVDAATPTKQARPEGDLA